MNQSRLISIFTILFFLTFSVAVSGQKKSPPSNVKDKAGKEDPWADYEEEKDSVCRWELGISFGAYFPNKYPANYYNGSPGNINNVNYIMSNEYWLRDIKQALGDPAFLILDDVQSYNWNMHYQVAITGGIFLRFNFDRKNGIFMQANYSLLNAKSFVTMKEIKYGGTFANYLQMPIMGREGRAILDVGYQRSFPMKSKIYYFVNGAVTMCYTHVLKSVMVVEGTEYNMINIYGNQYYVPNTNIQEVNNYQNGLGWGGSLGGGVGIPLNDTFGLEPGATMQYYPVNLIGYHEYRPNFTVYLRILLGFSHKVAVNPKPK